MAPNVVLVTGVADPVGRRLAARLAGNPRIDRVLGVDTRPPAGAGLGRVEFVAADLRSPRIGNLLTSAGVDTVVHADVRAKAKERTVIGTMQLLAACQRAPKVRKLVVKSTAEVYGAGPTSPAVFTEQDVPAGGSAKGYGRVATEIEDLARGFARRRSDVAARTRR
jgi:UDP-glucose 4-epimerase